MSFVLAAPQIFPEKWLASIQSRHKILTGLIPDYINTIKRISQWLRPRVLTSVKVIGIVFAIIMAFCSNLIYIVLYFPDPEKHSWLLSYLNGKDLRPEWGLLDYGALYNLSFYVTAFGIIIATLILKGNPFKMGTTNSENNSDYIDEKLKVASSFQKALFWAIIVTMALPIIIVLLGIAFGFMTLALFLLVAFGIPFLFIYIPFLIIKEGILTFWRFLLSNDYQRIALVLAFILFLISLCLD